MLFKRVIRSCLNSLMVKRGLCAIAGFGILISVSVSALFISSADASTAGAQRCLLESNTCAGIVDPKRKNMLKVLRKKPSQYVGVDSLTVGVIYKTLEDSQNKVNKSCRAKDKVALDGFKPLFITGSGKSKRALMMKDKNTCSWVKVK